MVQKTAPLDFRAAIVNVRDGTPTPYFMRQWVQQRDFNAGTVPASRQIIAGTGLTGGGDLSQDRTLSADAQAILNLISTTRGVLLYRGATLWAALAPGTAGEFLKTNGAGADPEWDAVSTDIQTLLDGISTTQGAVLYRNATDWVALAPGTAGNVLTTGGSGANPSWAATGSGGGSAWTLAASLTFSGASGTWAVTGLAGANELLLIADRVTTSSSAILNWRVSTNNGSSFFNTSGDYRDASSTLGPDASRDYMFSTYGGSQTGARQLNGHILNPAVTNGPKYGQGGIFRNSPMLFVADNSNDIDAVQLSATAGNLSGGTGYVYKR